MSQEKTDNGQVEGAPEVSLLGDAIQALEEHVADPANLQKDDELRGSGLFPATIVLGVILFLCICGFPAPYYMPDGHAGTVISALSSFGFIVFFFWFIGMLFSDKAVRHIQDVSKPEKAYKRFFKAAKRYKTGPLLASLVPTARKVDNVRPLTFTKKIPPGKPPKSFGGEKGLKGYWRYVLRGPSSHTRNVVLLNVKKVKDLPGDVAILEVKVRFSSYPASFAFAFGALIVLLIQKRETKLIRKLLIRRNEKWYFLSGEFQGEIDRLAESM